MGALQTLDATTSAPASAVIWLNGRQAIIAGIRGDEQVSQVIVNRGPGTELEYLAAVVRAIGDRERVMILGPNQVRLDLEREYVSIYRRPERLVDVEPAGRMDAEALVEWVRRLAS
ncbi:MAG TPA: hypothetical protein VHM48_08635 [Candidatus Limnocylindrales bacterium]|nr:hypothetical protein [Candidatus Limnocylindrales bacterium]